MLSRIADSLFWLNRYMERADGMLRILQTHYNASLDTNQFRNGSWRPMVEIFSHADEENIARMENDGSAALKHLLLDTSNLNSLKVIVTRARENARGAQDHITKEVWEEVNHLYHLINQTSLQQALEDNRAMQIMVALGKQTLLFAGTTDITMPRGQGWCFMNAGKYVERCLETLVMTNKEFAQVNYDLNNMRDITEWRYLLLCLSGYELHLKTYRTTEYNKNVMHQVLFNEDFTRSLVYSLSRLYRYLENMTDVSASEESAALMRSIGRLYNKVRYTEPFSINGESLQSFLRSVKKELLDCSKQLSQVFFSYA